MKIFILLAMLLYIPYFGVGQRSLVKVYNSHHFLCDTESTTVSTNLCSRTKVEFADSLLNKLYRTILKSINKEIVKNSSFIRSKTDSTEIKFALKERSYYRRMKQTIIDSQRTWVKLRSLNGEVEDISCEGGTGCVAMVNGAYIEDTLDRIKKLESFYSTD